MNKVKEPREPNKPSEILILKKNYENFDVSKKLFCSHTNKEI